MSVRRTSPQPGGGSLTSPEFLALAARYRVLALLKELARLAMIEHETRAELARLVGAPGPAAAAAAELARLLERLSKGE